MAKHTSKKSLANLLDETSLDNSFVLGYYGGGNYGDELLLEVLQHVFKARRYQAISFLYQNPGNYQRYHKDLGYERVNTASKWALIRTIFRRKNLIIGGGGLWGLDVNLNVVLMSVMLLTARWFLGKNVYLIGVGYYGSTGPMGHAAAWMAGKAATQILARDPETYRNFSKINSSTYLTNDIAFTLPNISQQHSVKPTELEEAMGGLEGDVTLISLRRFKPNQVNPYIDAVDTWLIAHPNAAVILSLMEPREVDPEGYQKLLDWQAGRSNTTVIDFRYNPMALYTFFLRHKDHLAFVGPQFHVQLVAHLAGVRLMPLVYDNKVGELLTKLNYQNQITIKAITAADINAFTEQRSAATGGETI